MSEGGIRIGLLGASRVATYAVIAPARTISGVRVHGVAARDPDRARRYAVEHGIERSYASYRALLDDPEIDLVYISTPPAYHVEQVLAVIAAGKPTLVEKPFALNAASARSVLDESRKVAVPVFEAMHSPHHALFARLLVLLARGRIGRVHVNAVFDAPVPDDDPIRWSSILGGGSLMDLGVHPLAWVRRVCGDDFTVTDAQSDMRGDVDASVSATLEFADGATATVASSMVSATPAARLEIRGDRGSITVRNPLAPQIGHLLTITIDGNELTETLGGPSTYEAQLLAVHAAVLNQKSYPFPADDFVRSMEAIDRVRTALGGTPSPSPLPSSLARENRS